MLTERINKSDIQMYSLKIVYYKKIELYLVLYLDVEIFINQVTSYQDITIHYVLWHVSEQI